MPEFKTISVAVCSEWDQKIDKLQREKFPGRTREEVIRYLINKGFDMGKQICKKQEMT